MRERSLSGLMSIHNVASFHAVGMYPIPSEKVKSSARWMYNGVPIANLSSSCVMVSYPGALSFLGSNLTILMCSFGLTLATSRWLSSLSWKPSLVDSSGVNMYGLASTNWLMSLRFVSLKLLHSIPKCLSTDSANSSASSALVLVVLLSSVSVG